MKGFRPSGAGRQDAPQRDSEPLEPEAVNGHHYDEPVTEEVESRMLFNGRRLLAYMLVVLVILVALYFVLPELTGLEDSLRKIEDADPVWITIALGFNALSFAAYIALFRGILGVRAISPRVRSRLDWNASYQITLAGLAATRLFSAGGAGGIALTYWALRRAGMGTRYTASRMVAFLVLLYTVYLLALVDLRHLPAGRSVPGPEPGRHDDRAGRAGGSCADRSLPAVADPR